MRVNENASPIFTMKGLRISLTLWLSLLIFLLPMVWYIGFTSLRKPIYIKLVRQSGLFFSEVDTREAVENLYQGLLTTKKITFPSAEAALTDNEQIHMTDVSRLLHLNFILCFILLTLFIISLVHLHRTNQWILLYHATLIASGVFLIMLVVGLFSFDGLFTLFHQLLFRNNLWLLPQESILLRLFPTEFFFHHFIGILTTSLAWFIVLFIVSNKLKKGRL